MKINPLGFREYDARWLYDKNINLLGIEDLGKGLGTQIKNHTKKDNRVIVSSPIPKRCPSSQHSLPIEPLIHDSGHLVHIQILIQKLLDGDALSERVFQCLVVANLD